MTLRLLASIAEDGPWCGTRPPGRPHPPHFRDAMLRTAGEISGPVDAVDLHCNLALAQCGEVSRPADRRCLLVTPTGVEWR